MEQKATSEMTLAECNAEIEAAGGTRKKRIDHARGLVTAIRLGKTTGAAAAAASAKRAVKGTKKATKVEPGTPALTTNEAEDTNIEPEKGGEEAPVATTTKAVKKAAKKAVRKNSNGKGKSIIADVYRSQYKKDKAHKTESGAVAVHNADGLATAMAGLDNGTIAKIGRENKVDVSKWSSLNPGQIRMNIGNVLRGMLRRGEKVTVNGRNIKV